jgi:hypothetical protein
MIKRIPGKVYLLKRDPFGRVEENGVTLAEQLDRLMDQGEDVVVISFSKGTPDVMSAILNLKTPPAPRIPFVSPRGQIVGFINMAGVSRGTHLGDSVQNTLGTPLQTLFRWISFGSDPSRMLSLLPNMAPWRIQPLAQKFVKTPVVRNSVVVEFVGVPIRFGMIRPNRNSPMLGAFSGIQKYGLVSAATDGFIEHPYSTLPKIEGGTQFQIPLDGSHMPLDGFVYQDPTEPQLESATTLDLSQEALQDQVFPAVIRFINQEWARRHH